MEKTINDLIREIQEKKIDTIKDFRLLLEGEGESGLACVPPSEWEWEDCDKGHVECYMAICPACKTIDRDCEDKQP